MTPTIRRLRALEASAYRDIRLRALAGAPTAFGTSLAEALTRPPEWWDERAAATAEGHDNAIFVAESDLGFCALAGGFRSPDGDAVTQVFSMWVDPEWRRRHLGGLLLDAVRDWSHGRGADELRLWVTEGNTPAIRLYERYGFTFTGATQPHPSQPSLRELEMRFR